MYTQTFKKDILKETEEKMYIETSYMWMKEHWKKNEPRQKNRHLQLYHIMRLKDSIFITLFSIIFIIGVVGNSLVIYTFKRIPRSLTSMELVIMYLALTDLVASIFNPPLYIYWQSTEFKAWHLGNFSCTVFPSINTLSVTMSLGLIQLITVERCRVLTNPMIKKVYY